MGLTLKTGVFMAAATAVSTGQSNGPQVLSKRTYQATVTGTGAISATVVIEGTNDEAAWVPLATLTPNGSDTATDGVTIDAAWRFIRGRVTVISGTSASVVGTASST